MKAKSFVLGVSEGAFVAIVLLAASLLKKHSRDALGFEIPSDFMFLMCVVVVFVAVLLITNNIRKLVFAEKSVPGNERFIECAGGVLTLVLATIGMFHFM